MAVNVGGRSLIDERGSGSVAAPRRSRPTLVTVVGLLTVAALLLAYRRDIPAAGRAIVHASPGWMMVLTVCAVAGVGLVGLLYRSGLRAAGAPIPGRHAAALGVSGYAVNLVVKSSGLAGLAVFLRYARARSIAEGPVIAGYLTATFLNHLAFAVMLAAAIVALVVNGRFTALDAVATALFAGYLAVHLAAAWAAVRRPGVVRGVYAAGDRIAGWWRRLLRRTRAAATRDRQRDADELRAALRLIKTRPAATFRACGWALSVDAIHVVWLWAALHAVGSPVGIDVALVAYGVATLFGIVGFLPAGLGFVEVGMAATLSSYSVPITDAAAAVVLFRMAELWLPLAAGWVASRLLPAATPPAAP